mmetsp:Transcript_12646/g.35285  ORF Transcript_12646/g.35285 Transcript_12646/m.35285 type:complete len:147 (-) Transcript_12646:368-808(-)
MVMVMVMVMLFSLLRRDREFLHWCQLNKSVQQLEDCKVKVELIHSDFTPYAKIEYVNGQFEELNHKMYTSRMIEHVLSQCDLVSEGKQIWEEEDWDDYAYQAEAAADQTWRDWSFDRELLDLVVMGEDYPADDAEARGSQDQEDQK